MIEYGNKKLESHFFYLEDSGLLSGCQWLAWVLVRMNVGVGWDVDAVVALAFKVLTAVPLLSISCCSLPHLTTGSVAALTAPPPPTD